MSNKISKLAFFADLHQRIAAHCETVVNTFSPLADASLTWQPDSKGRNPEWNILQCFDHLNLTHAYYIAKLNRSMTDAPRVTTVDLYRPSFWGGIYMYFSLNPTYTFPSPEPITPATQPERQVLNHYLAYQEALRQRLDAVAALDLNKTMVPIEKFVRFNLGDCLKILVYHDELHIGQALRVYEQVDR